MPPTPTPNVLSAASRRLPLLSVVVPVYNGARYIAPCIATLDQLAEMIDLEVIIQDACSTDGTSDIVASAAAGREHWHHIREKDTGQSDAINRGVVRAQAEWVTWLCADDMLLPDFVAAFAKGRAAEADVIYGDVVFVTSTEGPAPAGGTETHVPGLLARSRLMIQQPGTVIRRDRWMAAGGVNLRHNWAMDYDLFLRLETADACFHRTRLFVAAVLVHQQAKTSSPSLRRLTEMWGILAAAHIRRPANFRLRPYAIYGLEYIIKRMESEHDGAPPSSRLLRLHKYFWRLASPSEADDIAARYAAESRVIEPLARQLLAAA